MDGVLKLNHYDNLGKASASIDPRLDIFYGPAESVTRELEGKKQLDLPSFIYGPDAPTIVGDIDDDACQTSLSCSRPESKATGPCDILPSARWRRNTPEYRAGLAALKEFEICR